jgi:hypothetical protein
MITAKQAQELTAKSINDLTNYSLVEIEQKIKQAIDNGISKISVNIENPVVSLNVFEKLAELGYTVNEITGKIEW